MHSQAGPQERSLEAVRTLACALVVLMHANAYLRAGVETWWPGGLVAAPLYGVAVPVFLMISGFLAARRTDAAGIPMHYLWRLLVPMVSWGLIMLLLGWGGERSWFRTMLDLITGVQHLFYLGVLAQLTLLLAFLNRIGHERAGLWLAAAVSFGAYVFSDAVLWSRADFSDTLESGLRKFFLPWAVFFFFGARKRGTASAFIPVTNPRISLLVCATLAAWSMYAWGFRMQENVLGYSPRTELLLEGLPFQFLAAWCLLAAVTAWQHSGRAARFFEFLAARGSDTYGIYLAHFPLLIALYSAWVAAGFSTAQWPEVPVFWLLAWTGSRLVVRLLRASGSRALQFAMLGERKVVTH